MYGAPSKLPAEGKKKSLRVRLLFMTELTTILPPKNNFKSALRLILYLTYPHVLFLHRDGFISFPYVLSATACARHHKSDSTHSAQAHSGHQRITHTHEHARTHTGCTHGTPFPSSLQLETHARSNTFSVIINVLFYCLYFQYSY